MVSQFDTLTVDRDPEIWEITLDRPDLLNRFDAVQETELTRALEELARDDSARAAVLLANGRVFSAGGDFELMLEARSDIGIRRATLDRARGLLDALTGLPQPLVVGVQGAAVGLGATIAVGGDVVVASKNARLGDTHIAIGLVAGDGGALFWPQSIGMLRARRYLLTGDLLSAEQAHAFGLVTDLVETPAEVAPAARAIAARIAALPPLAVRGTKKALNQVTRQRAGEVVETALLAEGETLTTEDMVEAIAAFRDKRDGKFVGR
ncbi:enoyl-CoA hydratase-related protein [Nocardia sp. R6R-6]|uniref:enoyl-CoA hydratase-related protein n=1 Tax=Nocardia sp. R6R-6 TaxID=3459303 RepID=UPI00403DB6C6